MIVYYSLIYIYSLFFINITIFRSLLAFQKYICYVIFLQNIFTIDLKNYKLIRYIDNYYLYNYII